MERANGRKTEDNKSFRDKIRDLKESRDNWKSKATEAQKKLTQLKKEPKRKKEPRKKKPPKATQEVSEVSSETDTLLSELTAEEEVIEVLEGELLPKSQLELSVPKGHVYPVFVIQLAIQQLIPGFISLRGCQLTFELFSQFFELATPRSRPFATFFIVSDYMHFFNRMFIGRIEF